MEKKGIRIMLAGGGTGGHLFPAIALAEEFMERSPMNEMLFIGTEKGLEARLLPRLGFPLRTITVEGGEGQRARKDAGESAQDPPGGSHNPFRFCANSAPISLWAWGGTHRVPRYWRLIVWA